jgi:hypothetical protein
MEIGELVRINDLNDLDPKRMIGTVIRHDMYDSRFNKAGEKISEVLWNNGQLGWILTSRLSVVSDVKADC